MRAPSEDRAKLDAMDSSNLHFRKELRGQGFSDYRLGAMCGRRNIVRVRRGAYIDAADYAGMTPEDRHLLAVDAAVHDLRKPAVVSHTSAALLLDLPRWRMPMERVHLTRAASGSGNRTHRKVLHALPLSDDDVTTARGITVTSPARTIVDVARMGRVEQAIIMGDHALNRAMITKDDLDAAAARVARLRGSRHASTAIAAMDHRSESVGETRCRRVLHGLGLVPTLQRVVRYRGGFVARVDFCVEDEALVIEFDGLIKYKLDGMDPEAKVQVLADEKKREENLTGLGLRVVRVVWKELDTPAVIRQRIARARELARSAPEPLWDAPLQSDEYRPCSR